MTRGQIVPRDTPENEGWLFAALWGLLTHQELAVIHCCPSSPGVRGQWAPRTNPVPKEGNVVTLPTISNSMTIQLGGLEPSLKCYRCVCGLYFEKPNIVLHLVFFMCETVCWQIGLRSIHTCTHAEFSNAPSNFSPTDSLILLLWKK